MNDNLATVSRIYEAFGKGDIPTILSYMAEDVQWEAWADNSAQHAGVPWLQAQVGHEGVLEFFQIIGQWKIHEFKVLSLMAGDNKVAVEFVIDADVPMTGAHLRDEEMHLWSFNEAGQVSRLRHYTDTSKHIDAAGITTLIE